MPSITNSKFTLVLAALLLILSYFPLFLHLDVLPLRIFDESRLAVSALEMTENGNLLIPHFDNRPDMWSLKPPLMIWLQAGCMKILGYNELAVRLPSALSGLFCILFLYWFCTKKLQSPLLGFISSLVLLTTPGFVAIHVTRTGEYDAMLCFFMLAYAFSFFQHLQKKASHSPKNIYFFGLFLTLAVLTKGIAGFLFLPALFLYALLKKQILPLISSRHTYIAAVGSVFFILAYYFGREYWNPGYLQAVWDNEIGGRYGGTLEGNRAPFSYYFEQLWSKKFVPWIWWLPFSIALGLIIPKNILHRDAVIFSLIISISFLLIISSAQTKLAWYLAPALPFLALLVGMGIYGLINYGLEQLKEMGITKKAGVFSFLLFGLFSLPYSNIIKEIYRPKDKEWNKRKMSYGPFLNQLESGETYYITQSGYNSHLLFYSKAHRKKGKDITVIFPRDQVVPIGSKVMICEDKMRKQLQKRNQFKVIDQYKECQLVEIISPDNL